MLMVTVSAVDPLRGRPVNVITGKTKHFCLTIFYQAIKFMHLYTIRKMMVLKTLLSDLVAFE